MRLLTLLGLLFLYFPVSAQSALEDISKLTGTTKTSFVSGSGREYLVKWKQVTDTMPADTEALVVMRGDAPRETGHVCPSVKAGGDNDAYDDRPFYDGVARCEAKVTPAPGAASTIRISDLSKKFKQHLKNGSFIQLNSDSPRSTLENKNYRLENVRIYAIKREHDEDYHLIIGPITKLSQGKLINVEITGLPHEGAPGYAALQAVREAFAAELSGLEGMAKSKWSRYLYFPKGIPVNIEGSVFFDVDHKGQRVGPKGMKSPTCMELHPVTRIEFIGPTD